MHSQQSERLPFFLFLFGMVGAVCAQDGTGIRAVELFEPGKTAVDVYVVDEEIRESVQRNAHTDEKHPKMWRHAAKHVTKSGWNGKNKEKTVVFFKKTVFVVFGLVVIFVPVPQNAVHHVFVREPGHKFHTDVCGKRYQNIKKPGSHDN